MPSLDKQQEKMLEDWNKTRLDAAALKLLDASETSLLNLHRGAKLPRCDWSLDYEDGIWLPLPHLHKGLKLARLAALHARHEFEQDRFQEGVEDLADVLVLARRLDVDPFLISGLVRYRIESIAIEALAAHLPRFDAAAFKTLSARLDKFPVGVTVRDKLLAEKKIMIESIIKTLQEAEKKPGGSWRKAFKMIIEMGEGQDTTPSIESLDQAVKLLEDLAPVYDQLAKLVALPKEEYDAQYPEFIKKATAANPLAGTFLPVVDKLSVAGERRNQAQMLLLKAALAVAQGGPNKVKDFKDPFGKGPFEYRAFDNGFELKSKLLYRDQPVTLTVGQGKKE
jgi:hypothetical protein